MRRRFWVVLVVVAVVFVLVIRVHLSVGPVPGLWVNSRVGPEFVCGFVREPNIGITYVAFYPDLTKSPWSLGIRDSGEMIIQRGE